MAQAPHELVNAHVGQRPAPPQEDVPLASAVPRPERLQPPVGSLADWNRPRPGLSPEHRKARHHILPGQVGALRRPGADIQEEGEQGAVPGGERQAKQGVELTVGEYPHRLFLYGGRPDQFHRIGYFGMP
ncbi:hypothetical protein ES703_89567 [subsurface metagenome]